MKAIVTGVALLITAAALPADDFRDAKILDVEAQQEQINGVPIPYFIITVELGSQRISARTYQIGGGTAYVRKHPEARVVGTTVPGRTDKNVLELKLGPDQKPVRLMIQRIENIASPRPEN